MKSRTILLSSLLFVLLLFFALSMVHASVIGASKVTLTQYSINITQGSSSNIGFTISLVSGSPWGTSIAESPSSSYVTFLPSISINDPTYSATLAVNVAKNAPVGKYIFNISATGDDPSISPVQLTVNVLNATTTSTPPSVTPPSTSAPKPTNYFVYVGGAFIVLVALFLSLAFLMKKKFVKAAKYIMFVSIILSLVAAAYLLTYDTLLRVSGMLHYDILIVFFILTAILTYFVYKNKKMQKIAALVLGSLSALFVLAMFLDALLGLPLTAVSGSLSYGFNYLFGFGAAGTGSLYGTSFAFSLLLLSVTITAILGIFTFIIQRK